MFKKWLMLLISVFFLLTILPNFVNSVPPVTTVNQFTTGYQLKIPTDNVLVIGKAVEFEVHVYNITDGVPIKTGIGCYMHLYNSTGKHILEMYDATVSHDFDYSFTVMGGNITKNLRTALFQCNSSKLGGYAELELIPSASGKVAETGASIVNIGLLFLLALFLVGCIVLIMESNNLLVRVGFIGIGYLLLTAISFIAWQMSDYFLLGSPMVISMFKILFYVLMIGTFPLLIGAFAWYFFMLMKIKEIENLMKHGMSEYDAEDRVNRRKR